jgi:1,4-alpha-glucan branching enzyme
MPICLTCGTRSTYSLEEKWLFEAITECYLPLISSLNRLADENHHFKITISLSPPLLSMLDDPYLQDKYISIWKNCWNWQRKR